MRKEIQPLASVDQMKSYLAADTEMQMKISDRETRQAFAMQVLDQLRYEMLSREDKGVVRDYLQKATGYSRAQVARLITQHRQAVHPTGARPTMKQWGYTMALCVLLLLLVRSGFAARGDSLQFLNGNRLGILTGQVIDQSAVETSTIETVIPETVGQAPKVAPLFVAQRTMAPIDASIGIDLVTMASGEDALQDSVDQRRSVRETQLAVQAVENIPVEISPFLRRAVEGSAAHQLAQRIEERRRARLIDRPESSPLYGAAPAYNQSEWVWQDSPDHIWDIETKPTTVWDIIGPGSEGQVLMVVNGKPSWETMDRADIGNPELGAGRKPLERRGGSGGGGSTTATTTSTTTTITQTVGDNDWTISGDNEYAAVAGNVGIGTIAPATKLEVVGTASGSYVHASSALTSSGGLTIAGAAIALKSFGTCNLETDASGNLICGIDDTVGTGLEQATADTRYVRVSGDTMTGGLLITSVNDDTLAIEAGLLLEVAGTASGRILHAEDLLTASGALSVDGLTFLNNNTVITGTLNTTSNISGSGTLSIEGASSLQGAVTFGSTVTLNGVTYTFPYSDGTASGKVLATDSAGQLTWKTDAGTTYDAAQGLSLDSNYFSVNSTLTGTLLDFTTVSGATLRARDSLTSSGTLSVDGLVFLNNNTVITGNLNTTGNTSSSGSLSIDGASYLNSILDVDGAATFGSTMDVTGNATFAANLAGSGSLSIDGNASIQGNLSGASLYIAGSSIQFDSLETCTLKTDADGNLTCGTDNTGTGYDQDITDTRYVRVSGDTMTGGLLITSVNDDTLAIEAGLLLEVAGTASGRILHAEDLLTSSGALAWEGTGTGDSLWVSTFEGAGLTNCDPTTGKLIWSSATKRFICGTDQTGAGASTLQEAYDNDIDGGVATIQLSSTDGSVMILNPASGGSTGTGAFIVDQNATTMTGILLDSEATQAPGLAIDMPSIAYGYGQALNPHILFGYNGMFDVDLYRSAANVLKTDDQFLINQDSNAIAFNIDSEATSEDIINLSVDKLTTGIAFDMSDLNALTTGKALNIVSNSTSTSTRTLAQFTNTHTNAYNTTVMGIQQNANGIGLNLLNGGTNNGIFLDQNGNGIALNIDSQATTTFAVNIAHAGDTSTETAAGMKITAESGAGGLYVYRNVNSATDDALVLFLEDNIGADEEVLKIQNDGVGNGIYVDQNGNGITFNIDSESTSQDVINLSASALNTGIAFDMSDLNALTTGKALNIVSNSTSTSTRTLAQMTNSNSLAVGATVLSLQQNAAQRVLFLDQNGNGTGILLDSEATGAPGVAIDMPTIAYGYGLALNPHILFGYNGTFDVNLYRSAANYLKTDDNFIVGGLGSSITLNGVEYLFPYSDGTASGKVLKTDGNGQLSWATDDNDGGEGSSTLQDAYNNDTDGNDSVIWLSSADDSIHFKNPATGGTNSSQLFVLNNSGANVTAFLVDQNSTGTGQIIDSESSSHPGLAIDMPSIAYGYGQALNPHILFGYNGMFDVDLYR
ncbi:MAG: hypothetical protein WCX61_03610, partial [Candidatus Peribacteraceae bacterium]